MFQRRRSSDFTRKQHSGMNNIFKHIQYILRHTERNKVAAYCVLCCMLPSNHDVQYA